MGIRLMQGYLLARPGFECLPQVLWPEEPTSPGPEAKYAEAGLAPAPVVA